MQKRSHMHIRDPVVRIRDWWIIETKNKNGTICWVALLCRSWLFLGKATWISHWRRNPNGTIKLFKKKKKVGGGVGWFHCIPSYPSLSHDYLGLVRPVLKSCFIVSSGWELIRAMLPLNMMPVYWRFSPLETHQLLIYTWIKQGSWGQRAFLPGNSPPKKV